MTASPVTGAEKGRSDEPSPAEARALLAVAERIVRPEAGLPDPVFQFLLRLTPMINVDLFVADAEGRVLLSWREDAFADGWHVPGGIIRGGEAAEARLALTAAAELGAAVRAQAAPSAILQLFGDRGHFISLVHRCELDGVPSRRVVAADERPEPGDLGWFAEPPRALYPTHEVYRPFWDALRMPAKEGAPLMATHHVSEGAHGRRGWRPE